MGFYLLMTPSRSHEHGQQLEEQLRETEKNQEEANDRVTQTEQKVQNLGDHRTMAKINIGKWMDANDQAIQQLKKKLAQQQDVATH